MSMTPEDRVREARNLLASQLLRDAFANAREKIVLRWKCANTTAEREECWQRQHLLDSVRKELLEPVQQAAMTEPAGGECREFIKHLDKGMGGLNG